MPTSRSEVSRACASRRPGSARPARRSTRGAGVGAEEDLSPSGGSRGDHTSRASGPSSSAEAIGSTSSITSARPSPSIGAPGCPGRPMPTRSRHPAAPRSTPDGRRGPPERAVSSSLGQPSCGTPVSSCRSIPRPVSGRSVPRPTRDELTDGNRRLFPVRAECDSFGQFHGPATARPRGAPPPRPPWRGPCRPSRSARASRRPGG